MAYEIYIKYNYPTLIINCPIIFHFYKFLTTHSLVSRVMRRRGGMRCWVSAYQTEGARPATARRTTRKRM